MSHCKGLYIAHIAQTYRIAFVQVFRVGIALAICPKRNVIRDKKKPPKPYSRSGFEWWSIWESNPRPLTCEASGFCKYLAFIRIYRRYLCKKL